MESNACGRLQGILMHPSLLAETVRLRCCDPGTITNLGTQFCVVIIGRRPSSMSSAKSHLNVTIELHFLRSC